jgi:peptidoglycan/xylan/chitin deacetylase (PgdA/CDA1 family)
VHTPGLWRDGVYIEQHPNGAQGSLAFSFDWESAMGGAIHSRGMEAHDPAGAAQHGLEMREGADWLADLFAANAIKATFYGTGYNLLDGNTERRTFADDPIYAWASPANRWSSDYWLTHKWYGDDPYGTYETHPAWYFGDQTRRLAEAGHEIASHTFGHLYVRGATPEELATDADEWIAAARAMGVMAPTTFAFPWRSSNSLTPDFYDVLYERGIRAVTRIYPLDMKDQYTIGAVGVYSDIAVMPDFLLGEPSDTMDEEAGGGGISMEEGLRVLAEIGRRRGTTSFWQHPEQLAGRPEFEEVREAWSVVVGAAARERDRGRLWIATVAEITAYQRDLISITTTLECGLAGWKVRINSALDRPISGVTLTLPGDVKRATSSEVGVSTVYHPEAGVTRVTSPGQGQYPARQLVLNDLKPGSAVIDVEWASGQEPLR